MYVRSGMYIHTSVQDDIMNAFTCTCVCTYVYRCNMTLCMHLHVHTYVHRCNICLHVDDVYVQIQLFFKLCSPLCYLTTLSLHFVLYRSPFTIISICCTHMYVTAPSRYTLDPTCITDCTESPVGSIPSGLQSQAGLLGLHDCVHSCTHASCSLCPYLST